MDSPGRQHGRLHGVSSTGRPGHARRFRRASSATSADTKSRMGSTDSVGAGRRRHERALHAGRPRARAGDVRGLDRPDRRGRAARRDTRPSAGPGAERRHHDVGLGGSQGLPARRDRERQAQSHRQRQRPDLRSAGRERRLSARRRSDAQRDEPDQADRSRSGHAELRGHAAGGAVAVLGRRGDLEQPDDRAQLRHGQAGSRVGRGAHPQARDAGVVSGGIGSSVGEVVPDQSGPARARALRSENQDRRRRSIPASRGAT